jgi:hypothetical protein
VTCLPLHSAGATTISRTSPRADQERAAKHLLTPVLLVRLQENAAQPHLCRLLPMVNLRQPMTTVAAHRQAHRWMTTRTRQGVVRMWSRCTRMHSLHKTVCVLCILPSRITTCRHSIYATGRRQPCSGVDVVMLHMTDGVVEMQVRCGCCSLWRCWDRCGATCGRPPQMPCCSSSPRCYGHDPETSLALYRAVTCSIVCKQCYQVGDLLV